MNKKLRDEIASALHEDWKSTRLKKDGTFEPRWKEVKDEKYVEKYLQYLKNGGKQLSYLRYNDLNKLEIDIANCEYKYLSADWQKENKEAATIVYKILKAEEAGKHFTLEEVGHIIHEAWRKRNPWCKGTELGTLFINLDAEEQDKDVRQYLIGKEVLEEYKKLNVSDSKELLF